MSQKIPKNPKEFSCDFCQYNTVNKKDYSKHILTRKHQFRTNENNLEHKNPQKSQLFECDNCGKTYKAKSGMWNHKKKCQNNNSQIVEKNNDNQTTINNDIVLELIKDNREMKQIIMDQNKTIQELIPKIGNTNNSNNNNNINIVMNNINFLNDKCKNALSLTDFINSIAVEVEDLEFTGKKGLIEGLSKLFLENYNKLPIEMRPLWCGDKKRKKLYIKEEAWLEDTGNQKTKSAIKDLSVKQAKNTNKFSKKYPNWMADDKKKDTYLGIINQTTTDVDDKVEKIISTLADQTHLTNETKDGLQTITE